MKTEREDKKSGFHVFRIHLSSKLAIRAKA